MISTDNWKYLPIVLIGSLFGCGNQEDRDTNTHAKYVVDAEALGDLEKDSLSHYIDRVELIPLETNEESVIHSIQKVSVSGEHIYILDNTRNAPIQVFRRNGEYVQTAGANGKGPGEYTYPAAMDWNSTQRILYVWDKQQTKIIEYTANGDFIRERNITESQYNIIRHFISLDNGNILLRKRQMNPEESGGVLLIGIDGKVIKTFFEKESVFSTLGSYEPLKRLNDQIFYTPIYSNEVYRFDQETERFHPYIAVTSPYEQDLSLFEEIQIKEQEMAGGNNRTEILELRNQYTHVYQLSSFFEPADKISLSFTYEGKPNWITVDKNTGKVRELAFLPIKMPVLLHVLSNSLMVMDLGWSYGEDPDANKEEMIGLIKDTASEAEIERIRSLTVEDNPVLAFYYFKK